MGGFVIFGSLNALGINPLFETAKFGSGGVGLGKDILYRHTVVSGKGHHNFPYISQFFDKIVIFSCGFLRFLHQLATQFVVVLGIVEGTCVHYGALCGEQLRAFIAYE